MRISDWSSDVCSSDLGRWRGPRHRARYTSASPRLRANQSSARAWWLRPWTPAFAGERLGVGRMRASPRRSVNILRSEERRVGKEWSVRVDLGGRRIIKKKKNNDKQV